MRKIFKIHYQPQEGFFLSIRLPERLVLYLLRFFIGRKKGRQKERIDLVVH